MDRKMIDNKGFTLVELMIVMALLALILGVGIPKYTRISDAARINEDMHKAASFIKGKRLDAFTQKDEITISVSASGDMISATIGTPPVADGSVTFNSPVGPASVTFTINSRGLFKTSGNIHLATVNKAAENSCVIIDAERIRLGGWDGATCTAN